MGIILNYRSICCEVWLVCPCLFRVYVADCLEDSPPNKNQPQCLGGYHGEPNDSCHPLIYNTIALLVFLIGIAFFITIFFLLINRKIQYLRYISKRVKEIANDEGFGSTIEIQGNDEIAELCMAINSMSNELKRRFDHERTIEKAKNELIGGVSHDLRTPLTSIKGYLQLLRDKKYQNLQELESYLNVAFSKTEMLENLIEDLFEYTRLSGKEISLNFQRLSLNDIIQQVIMDYAPLFKKEGLNLQATIPPKKFYVQIDPEKFVRVIENLLGNALKYSLKPGEVWINLSLDGQGVRMAVENKGPQIDPESLAHLFDRFYRLEKSRSKETGGAGLGLAIAKSIVELHSGKIWAESQNETTKVNVWLPLNNPCQGNGSILSILSVEERNRYCDGFRIIYQ